MTSWRWVVSFTPRPHYPRESAPGNHWIGGLVNPTACLEEKILDSTGLELRPFSRPARSQSLYQLRYPVYPSLSLWISFFVCPSRYVSRLDPDEFRKKVTSGNADADADYQKSRRCRACPFSWHKVYSHVFSSALLLSYNILSLSRKYGA